MHGCPRLLRFDYGAFEMKFMTGGYIMFARLVVLAMA